VLAALSEFGEAVGMESHPELIAAARTAGLDVRAGHLPDDLGVAPGWADVALLLDVIEHVDDDVAALGAARRAMADGGWLVVTVPAYRWLWSGHDEALGHRRRYTARGLRVVAERAGFRVQRVSYFNTLLFPAVALVRLWKGLVGDRDHDLRRPSAAANRLLEGLFALERHVVPRVALPFGGSLILIARR
jgi:SAM-dependent methyltransferase